MGINKIKEGVNGQPSFGTTYDGSVSANVDYVEQAEGQGKDVMLFYEEGQVNIRTVV